MLISQADAFKLCQLPSVTFRAHELQLRQSRTLVCQRRPTTDVKR